MAGVGRPSGRPLWLDFNSFRDCQDIFKLNSEIPNGAVHLGLPKQELNRAQIAGLAVNVRYLARLIECVPYEVGSRPIDLTYSRTKRAYWRVKICSRS